jgi:hypothetical protein
VRSGRADQQRVGRELVPDEPTVGTAHDVRYLRTKRERMHHDLVLTGGTAQ